MKAWYFSDESKTLRHGDGREIAIGETHSVEGTPNLCVHGLHGSKRILNALTHAPGAVIWRIELSGKMDKGTDKISAQHRKYISGGIDISELLSKFARMCALDVVDNWDAPAVVKEFLKTGNPELRSAAESAAWSVVWSAVWSAAGPAAWSAARSAARSAAWSAERSAAWSAVRSAARSAAWSAARSAAESAAWSATREKQTRRLTRMVNKALKEDTE